MKDIECPACGEMIPGDSKYCDMCGAELLQCVNCGALGTGQFCPECGKPMIARKPDGTEPQKPEPEPKPEPKPTNPINPPAEPKPTKPGGDVTIGKRPKGLVLKAREGGIILKPADGAVIGRQKGTPYAELLADLDLISRLHGRFEKKGRGWCIVDTGSTNGTLVNDVELEREVPMQIKAGDVVDIGTYLFDVIER